MNLSYFGTILSYRVWHEFSLLVRAGKRARLVLVEMLWLISSYIDGYTVKDKINILSLSHALGGLEPCNYMDLCQEVWLEVYDIRRREHMAMKKSDISLSFVSFGIFHDYDREEFQ